MATDIDFNEFCLPAVSPLPLPFHPLAGWCEVSTNPNTHTSCCIHTMLEYLLGNPNQYLLFMFTANFLFAEFQASLWKLLDQALTVWMVSDGGLQIFHPFD